MSCRLTILAVGGAGCRVMKRICGEPHSPELRLFAVDSDESSLENSGLPAENRLLVGKLWRNGRGCGGDSLAGQRAFSHDRPELERILSNTDMLLVTGGLGGGTASGGLAVLLSVAAKLHLPTALLLSLPFAMEGYRRRKLADDTVSGDLLGVADLVLTLPNDLLFASLEPETPLSMAFELADREMARTLLGLSAVLCAGNLLSADFASLCSLLKRRKSVCAIGIGLSEGADCTPEAALEKLLASPLLGGASQLQQADAVIFTLLGGPTLSLASAKAAMELAERQTTSGTELLLGAATAPEWDGVLQLIAIAIKYDESDPDVHPGFAAAKEKAAPASRRRAPAHRKHTDDGDMIQPTLPLLDPVDKGIMENTMPVIFHGENLDVPTYQRRNIVIEG